LLHGPDDDHDDVDQYDDHVVTHNLFDRSVDHLDDPSFDDHDNRRFDHLDRGFDHLDRGFDHDDAAKHAEFAATAAAQWFNNDNGRSDDHDDGCNHDVGSADLNDIASVGAAYVASDDRIVAEHPPGHRSLRCSWNRCWWCGDVNRQWSSVDGQWNGSLCRTCWTGPHCSPSASGLTRKGTLTKSN
jgi:hypothetical protein